MTSYRLVVGFALALACGTSGCVNGFRVWSESSRQATDVVIDEYGPEAINRKYQWLREARESLDQKQANIEVRSTVLRELEEGYGDIPRSQWDRTDKAEYSLARSELTGAQQSYNSLAAQYNAEIKKVTTGIAQAGIEPPVGFDGLPTRYAVYSTGGSDE